MSDTLVNDNPFISTHIVTALSLTLDYLVLQANKLVMEKRRRERINTSLDHLKTMMLQTRQSDVSICIYTRHIREGGGPMWSRLMLIMGNSICQSEYRL